MLAPMKSTLPSLKFNVWPSAPNVPTLHLEATARLWVDGRSRGPGFLRPAPHPARGCPAYQELIHLDREVQGDIGSRRRLGRGSPAAHRVAHGEDRNKLAAEACWGITCRSEQSSAHGARDREIALYFAGDCQVRVEKPLSQHIVCHQRRVCAVKVRSTGIGAASPTAREPPTGPGACLRGEPGEVQCDCHPPGWSPRSPAGSASSL